LHLCLLNIKKFCKALVDAPIRFLIIQNRLKMKKYGGESIEEYKNIFSKKLKETITYPLLVFLVLLLYF